MGVYGREAGRGAAETSGAGGFRPDDGVLAEGRPGDKMPRGEDVKAGGASLNGPSGPRAEPKVRACSESRLGGARLKFGRVLVGTRK